MQTLVFKVLVVVGIASLALIAAIGLRHQFAEFHRFVLRTPKWQRVFLALLAAAFIAYGGTKTNQVGDAGLGLRSRSTMGGSFLYPTVTPEDLARGWRLWEVKTNCNISYAMPEDATVATNWWMRGAYEDVKLFDFGSWRFPFGTNEYSALWAFSWGKVRFALDDGETEVSAVGAPMSAVPYRSRLWTVVDANDSRLVTWENFALNRDTNTPVNAQIELRRNGDFITRSNEVESVYRHINSEDWDGDGWRNEDDCNPYDWERFDGYFYQELPEGADESAYYWIDIRPQWNSDIWFYGDAPSGLDDPYICGEAGATYRVYLLIGKGYLIEGSQPFDIVAKSDNRIGASSVGFSSFTVVWPVAFTVAEGRVPESRPRLGATVNTGGRSFYVMPNPSWLRGEVVWTNEVCCEVWGDGTNFTYACGNACVCAGCTVCGNYLYEGYALPIRGAPCGCHYVEDHGPLRPLLFGFDKSAVIYEEPYTNMPRVVAHPASSNSVLRCSVYGGTYGGILTVTLNERGNECVVRVGGDDLPTDVMIGPNEEFSFETEYAPLSPSHHEEDIVATLTLAETFTGNVQSHEARLTSIRLATVTDFDDIEFVHRKILGVGEVVRFVWTPNLYAPQITSTGLCDGASSYTAPSTSARELVTFSSQDAAYAVEFETFEPQDFVVLEAAGEGSSYPNVAGNIDGCLTLCVIPTNVSFQAVEFAEIGEVATNVVGYFAQERNADMLDHSAHGADVWHGTHPGGWFYDELSLPTLAQPWGAGGSFEWPIPRAWRMRKDPQLVRRFARSQRYDQRFELDADGTTRIIKMENVFEGNTNCQFWINGELQ